MKLTDSIYLVSLLVSLGLNESFIKVLIKNIISFKIIGNTYGTYISKGNLLELIFNTTELEDVEVLEQCIHKIGNKVILNLNTKENEYIVEGKLTKIPLKSKRSIQNILKGSFGTTCSTSLSYLFNANISEEDSIYIKSKVSIGTKESIIDQRLEVLHEICGICNVLNTEENSILLEIATNGELMPIEPMLT